MRLRILLGTAVVGGMLAPAAANADFAHVVVPGETLTSIAATDGMSVAQLAAANGISPYTEIVAGAVIQIPAAGVPYAPSADSGSQTASTAASGDADGDGDLDVSGSPLQTPAASTAAPSDGYTVQPGDTLSAIAARAGTTVAGLAAVNGLDPNALLLAGTVLTLSGGSGPTSVPLSSASSAQPIATSSSGAPYPTPERVTANQIDQVASANGVPPSLATAIGWQESGFNNDLVSSADARGVMQILPGTWDWVNRTMTTGQPLAPASAIENVRGGVLLLRSLLASTGGDPALAAAAYYQGLASVQRYGMYSSTQQYVNNVMSLRAQFGGP